MSKPTSKPEPLTPRRRSFRGIAPDARKQLRRRQLVDAAIEAFGRRGFHVVTVREICVGAKLTERYFYESFSGLDQLFNAVYSQISSELREATLTALAAAHAQPMELAEAALRVFFEYVRDDPRRARIMLIEAVSIGHDSRRLAEDATRDFMILIRDFIDRLMPEARRSGIEVDLLAAGLVGANIHIATGWLQTRFKAPLEQVLFTITAMYRTLIAHMGEQALAVRATAAELSSTLPSRNRKHRAKVKASGRIRSPPSRTRKI